MGIILLSLVFSMGCYLLIGYNIRQKVIGETEQLLFFITVSYTAHQLFISKVNEKLAKIAKEFKEGKTMKDIMDEAIPYEETASK